MLHVGAWVDPAGHTLREAIAPLVTDCATWELSEPLTPTAIGVALAPVVPSRLEDA